MGFPGRPIQYLRNSWNTTANVEVKRQQVLTNCKQWLAKVFLGLQQSVSGECPIFKEETMKRDDDALSSKRLDAH